MRGVRLSCLAMAISMIPSLAPHLQAQVPGGRAAAKPAARSAPLDAQQVKDAISRGVDYLKRQQDPRTGTWNWEWEDNCPGGVTALCTLALLNSGVPLDDPVMVRALQAVRRPDSPLKTYAVALKTMVLCAAEPERDRPLIRNYVAWLQKNQVTDSPHAGAWKYGADNVGGDPSNTQFAMLALYEAERVGIEVQDTVWRRGLGYWTRLQAKESGSWNYEPSGPASGSMACAGIGSTIIALGQVTEADALVRNDQVECCQPQADDSVPYRGLEWLAKHFSVAGNPFAGGRNPQSSSSYYFYYMYGVERVGRMTANRFIGQHDWYREGAEVLLRIQDPITGTWKGINAEANEDIATSLALLFLSKGRRPVVACKFKTGDDADWNRHRHDLANLTSDVERRWKRDLSWQVIDSRAATLEDLLQTPVLYLSGRDGLQLATEQKQLLKQYVEHGGFIFAVRCCEGAGFDRDFRALLSELFPDNELRLLPTDHPIWYAEQPIPADYVPAVYGLDACCRTSIVYCPDELSGYWEVGNVRKLPTLTGKVKNAVQAKLALGANVLTYATNRELKEKLDAPQLANRSGPDAQFQRGTLYVGKLQHSGGSDDAPAALRNLLDAAGQQLNLRVGRDTHMLAATSEQLFNYPILFTHGRRAFRFSAAERVALAIYLKRGGFLFADSICANPDFVEAFRNEMKAILPDHPLQPIAATHPMWTDAYQGYDVRRVQLRNPRRGSEGDVQSPLAARLENTAPELEGIEIDGRLTVVFSPLDLSCALENQASIECKGYPREDAAKLGVNILLYAMQQ